MRDPTLIPSQDRYSRRFTVPFCAKARAAIAVACNSTAGREVTGMSKATPDGKTTALMVEVAVPNTLGGKIHTHGAISASPPVSKPKPPVVK